MWSHVFLGGDMVYKPCHITYYTNVNTVETEDAIITLYPIFSIRSMISAGSSASAQLRSGAGIRPPLVTML